MKKLNKENKFNNKNNVKLQFFSKYILSILLFIGLVMFNNSFVKASDLTNSITTPQVGSAFLNEFSGVIKAISTLAQYASVGALIAIGVKYLMSASGERANLKQNLINYVIGAGLAFGVSSVISFSQNLVGSADGVDAIAGRVLYIITFWASFASLAVLIFIGIKYLLSSVEERAQYKATIVPYVVGAILIFGASNLATALYGLISQGG